LSDLFGLREVSERRDRFEVRLSEAAAAWGGLAEPEERLWNLGRRHDPGGARNAEAQFGTYGYAVGDAETLASFDDGAAALTRRIVGRGRAYALGFDPGALLLAGQSARAQDVERVYANGYTPQNDALLAILVRIWREGDPLAVSLAPVPDGRNLAVVLTFDVDFTRSLSQAVAYAELLRSHDVRGTFFVQAKYMRDYNDDIILNEAAKLHLRRLHDELGMELASHTVSHSNAFRSFEMGSGRESYPDYRPVALSRDRAEGGTILGELRVSKYLLEALAPGSRVTSFRPGHLSQPFAMPQALQATGYLYSSTATAGTALSHLPYRLTHDRGPSASTGIFEFPITIEDELGLFMGSRLGPALDVARKVAGRRGILVVLTHPNVLGHKLDFNRRLIEALRGTAWFGALDDLGSWWAARDGLEMVVEAQARDAVVRLDAAAPLSGLTLAVPSDWRLAGTEGDVDGARPSPGRVVLGRLTGRAALRFEVDRASHR
jgi:peptidoglycan/xylan/chitin deacetylase (PgdA/CDA1 family)